MRSLFRTAVLLFAACVAALARADTTPAKLLSDPLSPEESQKRIHVLPGFAVDLVASEPLIDSPVAIDWSADGKLWVVEMIDYPTGLDGKGSPGGRVVFLTDTDDDGTFDKSTVFLDGLRMPTGIAPWRDGVLITVAGEILFAADTDGDGKADKRESLFTGFKEGNPQLRVNGLRWGGDGWIYCASGLSGGLVHSSKTGKDLKLDGHDLRINPDTGAMELLSGPSQFGRDCDDSGNWFGVQNSNPLFHIVLEDRYLRRNPAAPPIDPKRQLVTPPNAPVFAISASRNQFDRTQASPGHPGHFTSACGISIYRDALLFPREEAITHAFTCEPVHNLVRHTKLKREGVSFAVVPSPEERDKEFLASEDPWFRPVLTRTGPDGALYVVDMYRYMVEHPDWMPAGGPERMAKLFRAGEGKGRIYRVRREAIPIPAPASATAQGIDRWRKYPEQFAVELQSPNVVRRELAHRTMLWDSGPSERGTLEWMARRWKDPAVQISALKTLLAWGCLEPEDVRLACKDAHPAVRRVGIELAEQFPANSPDLLEEIAATLVDDPDASVRLQLACTIGMRDDVNLGAVLAKLIVSPDAADPHYAAAVIGSAPSNFPAIVEAVTKLEPPPVAGALYGDLAGMALARNDRSALAQLMLPLIPRVEGKSRVPDETLIGFAQFLDRVARQGTSLEKLQRTDDSLSTRIGETTPFVDAARSALSDASREPTARTAAATILGHATGDAATTEADMRLLTSLLQPQTAPEVQSAAVKSISRRGNERTPALLTAAFTEMSPRTRADVIEVLLSREAWAVELLRLAEAGKFPVQSFDPARRQRLTASRSKPIRTAAEKLFGSAASDASARAQVIEKRKTALSLGGDATRGLKVFTDNCATCHRLGDRGNEVGPDLRSVSAWEPEALLVAILDPNRLVEPRYLSYTAILADGQSVFGIITSDTASGVSMKGLDGKEQAITRSAIRSLTATNRSLMPDGFEAALKDRDIADLIAFLKCGGIVGAQK